MDSTPANPTPQVPHKTQEFWDKILNLCDEYAIDISGTLSCTSKGILPIISLIPRKLPVVTAPDTTPQTPPPEEIKPEVTTDEELPAVEPQPEEQVAGDVVPE